MMDNIVKIEESLANAASDELRGKYLTFWTDKQLFGISIAEVVQIIQMQPITEIPEFPPYAKGIIDLRGSVIPIIDMRLRLGKAEAPYDDHTCIIVTGIEEKFIGFIVDNVEEVTGISEDQISPPPNMSTDCVNFYLTGIGRLGGKVILLLDAKKMLVGEQFIISE